MGASGSRTTRAAPPKGRCSRSFDSYREKWDSRVSEVEFDAAEDLLSILAVVDVLAVEVLDTCYGVLEECVVRADFPALRAGPGAVVRRIEGYVLAEVAVGGIGAPAALVRRLCTLVVEHDRAVLLVVVGLRVLGIGTAEGDVLVKRL